MLATVLLSVFMYLRRTNLDSRGLSWRRSHLGPVNAQCGLQLVRFGLQDVPSSANSSSRWPPKKGHHMDTFKSVHRTCSIWLPDCCVWLPGCSQKRPGQPLFFICLFSSSVRPPRVLQWMCLRLLSVDSGGRVVLGSVCKEWRPAMMTMMMMLMMRA